MLLADLVDRIPLSDGRGYIPCSADYKAVLEARDALFRPTVDQPPAGHLPRETRDRWFALALVLDRLQWQGGHVGGTVWYDPPGDVPHGWAILKKRDKHGAAGIVRERDDQWRIDSYITATGDNGENDRGLRYAPERVSGDRSSFKAWADRRDKPHDTQYLLVACFAVDAAAVAASIGFAA